MKSLLDTLNLSTNAVNTIIKLILLVMGFVALALLVQPSTDDVEFEQQLQLIEQYKKDAEATVKYVDSLKKHIEVSETKASNAMKRADKLSGEVRVLRGQTSEMIDSVSSLLTGINDSTEMARRIIPMQQSIIQKQQTTIHTQERIIAEVTFASIQKDTTIMLLTLSNDSLRVIVNKAPEAPKNPNKLFGLIPLPNRKAVAVVFTAVGTVIGVVLTK